MKANITLKLDAEILREARILAPNREIVRQRKG
jgi:hypothetical protein